MTAVPPAEPTIEPWTYRVSPFAPGTQRGRHWCVWIKSLGDGRWRVLESYQSSIDSFLTADGEWTMDRDDDGIDHDFETAQRLACEVIPRLRVGTFTYDDAVNRPETFR